MKHIIYVLLLFCTVSCKLTDSDSIKNTSSDVVPTADKDANGCSISSGFIWSKITQDCIKLFSGIQLNPISDVSNEDETLSCYLLFDESNNTAEIFLPNLDDSILLRRKSETNPWFYENYELVSSNGYILKKDGKAIFSGDGEIGRNITESHDSEEISNDSLN